MKGRNQVILRVAVLWSVGIPGSITGQELVDTLRVVYAPDVMEPIRRDAPAHVVIQLEAHELKMELTNGVEYEYWTFDGHVPGPLLRVRQGDIVELHLRNRPDSRMPHNIDLHAVSGPGGGASASFVAPGQATSFTFHARVPGLYVYHCATAPVGMHIANGMYGLILVEPPEGLGPADREYYVMQSEFYTDGAFGDAGLRHFSMQKALDERPDYVVFNGSVGALWRDRALTSNVGERVRIFVGNAGPNLTSSFHIAGQPFDAFDGTLGSVSQNQTVLLAPGSAAIVEMMPEVPGTYVLLDHAMFRAFNKGAIGQLIVQGEALSAGYRGRIADDVYLLEGSVIQTLPKDTVVEAVALTTAERVERGRRVYEHTCVACHQADGRGVLGSFPPLAGADFLNADPERAVRIVLNGLEGPIVVNQLTYNAVMPALRLTDDQIADVLTYVYSDWGNMGFVVSRDLVRRIRLCPWCEEGNR